MRAAAHVLAVLALAALSIAHTWPLALSAGTTLPGLGLADNVSFLWNAWWMRQALADGASYFHSPLLMAPLGAGLVLHTHTALAAMAGATLLRPLPVVEALNLLLIAGVAMNGIAVYGLARELGARPVAAFAGGALFLVSPAVTSRLMGHFNLVAVWPFVLACWAWVRFERQATVGRGAALGAAAALVAYSDYYLLVYLGMFAAVHAVASRATFRLTIARRRRRGASYVLVGVAMVAFAIAALIGLSGGGRLALGGVTVSARSPLNALTAGWLALVAAFVAGWRVTWGLTPGSDPRARPQGLTPGSDPRLLAIAALVFVVLTFPLVLAGWSLLTSGDYVTQSASLKNSPPGLDVASFVLGPPFHGLAGARVRALYDRLGIDVMESSGWIGLVPLALAAVALLRHRRDDRVVRVWGIVAAAFLVWSLGAYLRVAGESTGFLLPQAIARYIPVLNNARMPGRAVVVVSLAACLLASRAFTAGRVGTWVVLVVGVLESIAAPLPLAALPVSPAQARVLGETGAARTPGAVLPIPFGVRDGFGERGRLDHTALYFQTRHGRPIAGGFLARLPPRVGDWYETHEPYRTLLRWSEGGTAEWPGCDEMLQGLRAGAVEYVVIDRDQARGSFVDEVRTRLPLTLVDSDERYDVLGVTGMCS